MIHRLCFGLQTRDPRAAREALGRVWPPGAEARIRDAGRTGLWVYADDPAQFEIAAAWSARIGAPVRLYSVSLIPDASGIRILASGRSYLPDGRVLPIASAREDDLERGGSGALAVRAEAWLQIVLEIHEQLDDADSRTELWP